MTETKQEDVMEAIVTFEKTEEGDITVDVTIEKNESDTYTNCLLNNGNSWYQHTQVSNPKDAEEWAREQIEEAKERAKVIKNKRVPKDYTVKF